MAKSLSDPLLYQGVAVDIVFATPQPTFGDLFLITGMTHPRFPPTGKCGFDRFAELQFEQVDDYFGVRSLTDEGDDVPIWLFPLVGDQPVHHHLGPFDGIRLTYCVLLNPVRRAEHFLHCVREFATIGSQVVYQSRGIKLGPPLDLTPVQSDIEAVVRHWATKGITVGSDKALEIDF